MPPYSTLFRFPSQACLMHGPAPFPVSKAEGGREKGRAGGRERQRERQKSFPRAVAPSVWGRSGLSGPKSYLMWQKGAQLRGQDNWPEGHFKPSLTPYQRETPAFAGLVGAQMGSPQHQGGRVTKVRESGNQEVVGLNVSLIAFLLYDLEGNFLSIGLPCPMPRAIPPAGW